MKNISPKNVGTFSLWWPLVRAGEMIREVGGLGLGGPRGKGSPSASKGPKPPIQLLQLLKNSLREVNRAHWVPPGSHLGNGINGARRGIPPRYPWYPSQPPPPPVSPAMPLVVTVLTRAPLGGYFEPPPSRFLAISSKQMQVSPPNLQYPLSQQFYTLC